MESFWLCFVPLFVAVDAVGVLPIFLSLTDGMDRARLRVVLLQSLITASIVALSFLGFGPAILAFLGVTVPDFMIAGGILLLTISLRDLLTDRKSQRPADDTVGSVPLGVPLISGPAVLTTSILLAGMYGKWLTAAAVMVNIALAVLVFGFARPITRMLGRTGTKTISKVASLLLTAIAVMLIRKGIFGVLAASPSP